MTPSGAGARFLMCAPRYFAVNYSINPWMDPVSWARNERPLAAASLREWKALCCTLADLGAAIELMPAAPNVPDLVFTANAAVVLDRTALLARFRHPERRAEEPLAPWGFPSPAATATRTAPEAIWLQPWRSSPRRRRSKRPWRMQRIG